MRNHAGNDEISNNEKWENDDRLTRLSVLLDLSVLIMRT